jgi:hypothetical protein
VLEALRGLRVVADPASLDAASWVGTDVIVLRFAPDDAVGLGASHVELADTDAIVEEEAGFVGAWLTPAQFAEVVVPHLEWSLPAERPALAQGSIAGVPAKLWLTGHGDALLLTAAVFADELAGRLR